MLVRFNLLRLIPAHRCLDSYLNHITNELEAQRSSKYGIVPALEDFIYLKRRLSREPNYLKYMRTVILEVH